MSNKKYKSILRRARTNEEAANQAYRDLTAMIDDGDRDPDAFYALGVCYEVGIGVAVDKHRARLLYQRAAARGSSLGMYHLGRFHELGIHEEGIEFPENIIAAIQSYYDAAKINDQAIDSGSNYALVALQRLALEADPEPLVFRNLAYCYEEGYVEEKDALRAMRYMKHAADAGDVVSCLELADMYLHGRPYHYDPVLAADYYFKAALKTEEHSLAANQGFLKLKALTTEHAPAPVALRQLAECYRYGYGVTKNLKKAAKYMRESASLLDDKAMYEMGVYYALGIGVKRDITTAAHWLSLSAQHYFNQHKEHGIAIQKLEILLRKYPSNLEIQLQLFSYYDKNILNDDEHTKLSELAAFCVDSITNSIANNMVPGIMLPDVVLNLNKRFNALFEIDIHNLQNRSAHLREQLANDGHLDLNSELQNNDIILTTMAGIKNYRSTHENAYTNIQLKAAIQNLPQKEAKNLIHFLSFQNKTSQYVEAILANCNALQTTIEKGDWKVRGVFVKWKSGTPDGVRSILSIIGKMNACRHDEMRVLALYKQLLMVLINKKAPLWSRHPDTQQLYRDALSTFTNLGFHRELLATSRISQRLMEGGISPVAPRGPQTLQVPVAPVRRNLTQPAKLSLNRHSSTSALSEMSDEKTIPYCKRGL